MLIFSPDQIQDIEHARMVRQLLEILTRAFPEDPPPDDAPTREAIMSMIDRSSAHLIHRDRDIARFVCVAYRLGTDFDTRFPAARAILADASRPAHERLTLLEHWAETLFSTLEGIR